MMRETFSKSPGPQALSRRGIACGPGSSFGAVSTPKQKWKGLKKSWCVNVTGRRTMSLPRLPAGGKGFIELFGWRTSSPVGKPAQ